MKRITVIGGGLAGCEAAYQIAKRGIAVDLYEMRPGANTEAHATSHLGEMVCSNSLGSMELSSASGLLKAELRMLDSLFLKVAERVKVPAGFSLAVDRIKLAEQITTEMENVSNINIIREEVKKIPITENPVIIATGPLTSADFVQNLTQITMRKNFYFYDATSPIVHADSIGYDKVFYASRYGKGEADFLNIPLTEEQYTQFVKGLIQATMVELKDFEKKIFFESCLPIEEIARRGDKSLSFGPLKPVGLCNPKTNEMPYAVIQLRQDDLNKVFFQMVGFQTRLKWGEQKRLFRTLPGLEKAQFERYGRIHRNTYINAPAILNKYLQSKQKEHIFFAGQISGVEGYVESIGSGLIAGIYAAKKMLNETIYSLPESCALGSLINYISQANWKNFTPTKFTFGLLPTMLKKRRNKKMVKELKAKIALENLSGWIEKANI